MRSCRSLALLLLLLACNAPAPPPAPPVHEADRIRARYFAMDTLFAQDRMARIAEVYAQDAVIITGRQYIEGREAIERYWDMLSGRGISWEHRISALEVCGMRAFQTGTSDLRYVSGTDTITSFVHYTLLWHKDAQGQWWIDRDHYTQAPSPTGSE